MEKAFTTSCRACLNESLESYFEMDAQCHFTSDDRNFREILSFCAHFEVESNDEFPRWICIPCAQDLQKTYEFLQKVLKSNKKLVDLKDCAFQNRETFYDNEFTKDPLDNATDIEDTLDNVNTAEYVEGNYDECPPTSFDNTDNVVDEDIQVTDTVISHLPIDNDDGNDGNFFKSVDSQIFPQGRLKCKICRKAYFTVVGLRAHMDIHLPKSKIFAKTSLSVGKYIENKRVIKSDISDNEVSNENNMTKSKSNTKQPKPRKIFPCEVCGKQMISASKLRYHMVMHTGEKDYLCTMCPKAYSTIYALKHHMRAHTGERPYECKFCGDRFLRPTTLKSHMRRHTGERPYGCDICGKRFIQHSSMATHMKLNHMDKTIPCPYCDKKYARQTDLNTHLLSHSGGKPFSCQICPSRFTRQSNLNKHINQQHSDVNIGDKKYQNKTIHETANDEFVQRLDSCNNNQLTMEHVFENPSCSIIK